MKRGLDYTTEKTSQRDRDPRILGADWVYWELVTPERGYLPSREPPAGSSGLVMQSLL